MNRGPEASLTFVPTLWFRNTWSWGQEGITKPEMHLSTDGSIKASPWGLPLYRLYCEGTPEFIFTENETNNERLFGSPNPALYLKDGFHEYLIHGKSEAVNPAHVGIEKRRRLSGDHRPR